MKLNNKIWKQVYEEQFDEGFKCSVRDGRHTVIIRYWLKICEKMVKRALTIRNAQLKEIEVMMLKRKK